jgi:hypothetical protein
MLKRYLIVLVFVVIQQRKTQLHHHHKLSLGDMPESRLVGQLILSSFTLNSTSFLSRQPHARRSSATASVILSSRKLYTSTTSCWMIAVVAIPTSQLLNGPLVCVGTSQRLPTQVDERLWKFPRGFITNETQATQMEQWDQP